MPDPAQYLRYLSPVLMLFVILQKDGESLTVDLDIPKAFDKVW